MATRNSPAVGVSGIDSANRNKTNPMYDSMDSLDTPWFRSQAGATQRQTKAGGPGRGVLCLVGTAIALDIILLIGVAAFEYLLRWRNTFPLRKKGFTCADVHLNHSQEVTDFDSFPLKAEIPQSLTYALSFTVPVVLVFTGEMLLLCLMPHQHKGAAFGGHPSLQIPQIVRRLYRFTVTYLFGAFAVMIFTDVLKLFVGELRPNFLQQCRPNCDKSTNATLLTDIHCQVANPLAIKDARTSFPSMQSAITMYAAVTIGLYLHGISRIHHAKYICVPFVSLSAVTLSIVCGLARLGRHYNWWQDIVVGHLIGASFAIYLGAVVLRGFKYQETVSNRRLNRQLQQLQSSDRFRDGKDRRFLRYY